MVELMHSYSMGIESLGSVADKSGKLMTSIKNKIMQIQKPN